VWSTIDTAVILTENMRSINDVAHTTMLNNVRVGKQTKDDYTTLSKRQLGVSSRDDKLLLTQMNTSLQNDAFGMTIGLSVSNAVRAKYSAFMTAAFSQYGPVYRIEAVEKKKGKNSKRRPLPPRLMEFFLSLLSSDVKRSQSASGIEPVLFLSIGSIVMLTRNVAVALGATKNMLGRVVGFKWADDTTFSMELTDTSRNNMRYIVPSKPPVLVYVDLRINQLSDGCGRLHSVPLSMPATTVPIAMSFLQAPFKVGEILIQTTIVQFPLLSGWAITAHKAQGQTLDSMVLVEAKSTKPPTQVMSLYVQLSRVTMLVNVVLLKRIDEGTFLYFFKPTKEIDDEQERMDILWEKALFCPTNVLAVVPVVPPLDRLLPSIE
jgi:hypothetical protein